MKLGEIIKRLESINPEKIVSYGFCNPHSYRGDYSELAFEPSKNAKIEDMLNLCKESLGKTF